MGTTVLLSNNIEILATNRRPFARPKYKNLIYQFERFADESCKAIQDSLDEGILSSLHIAYSRENTHDFKYVQRLFQN